MLLLCAILYAVFVTIYVYEQLKMKLTFRILLIIFGVVIVLFKYWDQSIIEKSTLYQKLKSKFLSGIQKNISATNDNSSDENQGLRTKIPLLKKNTIIKNNSSIMEILQNLTIDNKNPSNNVKKQEESKDSQLILKKVGPCDCPKLINLSISDEFINSTTCSRVGILK